MSPRTAARLAWGSWALSAALLIVAFVLTGQNGNPSEAGVGSPAITALFGVAFLAFPTVGAFVVSRRPENSLAWIFCAVGLIFQAAYVLDEYTYRALVTAPGVLPAGQLAAWGASWLFLVLLGLTIPLTLLLFPNGRLLSRRWRGALWLTIGATLTVVLSLAVRPGPLNDYEFVDNPLGIDAMRRASDAASLVGFSLVFLSVLAAVVSIVERFRRSRGEERQQLKWFAAAAATLGISLTGTVSPVMDAAKAIAFTLFLLSVVGLPAATGVAILRYRLYDIDRIINRTLVYGLLTTGLGGTYFGLVVGLQALFRPLTGGSGLAITATTLVVAAAFQPARRRIQDTVDSRFNRRRYDAAQTLAAFSGRLRDIVDLDTLERELLVVVEETVEPAHVSLWLRPMETRR